MVDLIVRISVSLLVGYIGYLIAFKKKIGLVHSYHIKNIRPEDVSEFCLIEGIGNMITAAGALVMSLTLIIAGVVVSIYAVYKYNGSLF